MIIYHRLGELTLVVISAKGEEMKRRLFLFTSLFFLLASTCAYSYTISGTVKNTDGTPVSHCYIAINDLDYEPIGDGGVGADDIGYFEITGLHDGDYIIQAIPNALDPTFGRLIIGEQEVTVSGGNSIVHFTLIEGGNVSGNISLENIPAGFPQNPTLGAALVEAGTGEWALSWPDIDWENPDPDDGSFPYAMHGVPAGEYRLIFHDYADTPYYQNEWYGNYPENIDEWQIPTIQVTEGETVTGIDASLHPLSASSNRYYISQVGISTKHEGSSSSPSTRSTGYASLSRFSDGQLVPVNDDITSFTVTTAGVSCTDYAMSNQTRWRTMFSYENGGFETQGRDALAYFDINCLLGTTGHASGEYEFTVEFAGTANGSLPLTKSTSVLASVSAANVYPVDITFVGWDEPAQELALGFANMGYNSAFVNGLEVRVFPFQNGHPLGSELRVRNLPIDQTSILLGPELNAIFNHDGVDQLKIMVITVGDNNTQGRVTKTFNFDYQIDGGLVEAPITMKLLDVDGDQKTGLAESIYSLQQVVNP